MISCAGTGGDDSRKGCANRSCQRRTRYRSNSRQTDGNSGCSLRGKGKQQLQNKLKKTKLLKTAIMFGAGLTSRSVSVPALPPGESKGTINLPVRMSPFSLTNSPCGTNAGQLSPGHGGLISAELEPHGEGPWPGVCQPWPVLRCHCPSATSGTGLLYGDYYFFCSREQCLLVQIFHFP